MIQSDGESCEFRETLRKDLLADEEFRYGYAESFLNTYVAAQIKAIREQRGMDQADLAERVGTKQPGISRLESVNHSVWKTDTLWRVARALGVRLQVSFETFGSLLDEVEAFNRESLERAKPNTDPKLLHPKPRPADSESTMEGIATETGGSFDHHRVFHVIEGGKKRPLVDQSSLVTEYINA